MSEQRIIVSFDDGVATIRLNRPEKLNAIDPLMLSHLENALDEIEQSPNTRVVLLTAAGDRAFCVGADIMAWASLDPLDMWRVWIRRGHRVFQRLATLRQPVIAVIEGLALGGGLELALAADLRLAAEGVQVGLPEVTIGTVPGWGGTQRLPALIGPGRAKYMIFSGQRVDALTAERWGLFNQVVARDELLGVARSLADTIAQNAPVSVQIAKQVIDGGLGLNSGVTLEALAGTVAASTADGQEGARSFRERRPPHFQGE